MGARGRAVSRSRTEPRRRGLPPRARTQPGGRDLPPPDGGSGTVLAVGVVAGLVTVLLAALALVAVLVAGQRARAAADLAALAAQGELVTGADVGSACGTAAQVAERNGGRLVTCTTLESGSDPWPRTAVTVSRSTPGLGWDATARAVAGGVVRDRTDGP